MLTETLSPSLAWTVASLTVPQQYAAIMQQAAQHVNETSKRSVVEIDK